jgi:hypothetical protein
MAMMSNGVQMNALVIASAGEPASVPVQFDIDPEPDHVGMSPDELPY